MTDPDYSRISGLADFAEFRVASEDAEGELLKASGGVLGPLSKLYLASADRGRGARKWHHYLPLYERYFAPFRDRAPKLLEIGVLNGGSLDMWRGYFGSDATIFGIDRAERSRAFDGISGHVRIGDQSDGTFLSQVVQDMGGIDLVIDDGSHIVTDIEVSFRTLFPLLSDGGLYVVEDLHASLWPEYQTGNDGRDFTEFLGKIAREQHWRYHGMEFDQRIGPRIAAVHLYDSMLVIEKGAHWRPSNSEIDP